MAIMNNTSNMKFIEVDNEANISGLVPIAIIVSNTNNIVLIISNNFV